MPEFRHVSCIQSVKRSSEWGICVPTGLDDIVLCILHIWFIFFNSRANFLNPSFLIVHFFSDMVNYWRLNKIMWKKKSNSEFWAQTKCTNNYMLCMRIGPRRYKINIRVGCWEVRNILKIDRYDSSQMHFDLLLQVTIFVWFKFNSKRNYFSQLSN